VDKDNADAPDIPIDAVQSHIGLRLIASYNDAQVHCKEDNDEPTNAHVLDAGISLACPRTIPDEMLGP